MIYSELFIRKIKENLFLIALIIAAQTKDILTRTEGTSNMILPQSRKSLPKKDQNHMLMFLLCF